MELRFGPKRGHPLYIFENFIKDFGLLIIAIVIGLVHGDMEVILENIGVLVIVLLSPVARILQYLFTWYSVDDEKLIVKGGLLNKKMMEIPLSTITTVDFSQKLLHQIFGAYRLNIDNASNIMEQKTKVMMTFGKKDAEEIRNLLIKGREGLDGFNLEAEVGPAVGRTNETDGTAAATVREEYRAGSADLLIMGAIKSKGLFLLELIGLFGTLTAMFNLSQEKFYVGLFELFEQTGAALFVLMITGVFFLLAVICGMAGTLIKYYGFHILDNGEAIKIEYGLLTRKRYTIQKNRISGFSYQQSMLMRLFKTGTLQLFAIGYGGASADADSQEDPILFPLLRENKVREIISRILPQMKEESEYRKPVKRSLHYFFCKFSFVLSLALLAATVWVRNEPYCGQLWLIALAVLAMNVLGIILQYKNAAIYGNENNISLAFGGYKKTTIYVKTNNVESAQLSGSLWKRKRGVGHVSVGYLAPLAMANQRVQNVSTEVFEEIKEKLIY